jgi:hypothetical protein
MDFGDECKAKYECLSAEQEVVLDLNVGIEYLGRAD